MNGCPHWLYIGYSKRLNIHNIAHKPNEDDKKVQSLILQYKSLKGEHVLTPIKNQGATHFFVIQRYRHLQEALL